MKSLLTSRAIEIEDRKICRKTNTCSKFRYIPNNHKISITTQPIYTDDPQTL